MKKYFLITALLGALMTANAQSISVPPGKKFIVTAANTSSISVSVMGQTIDNVTDITSIQDYTVKSVGPKGYTLILVPKRVSGTVSVMGQEQKFDTDDEASKEAPLTSGSGNVINKPQEIIIENGKVISASAEFSNVLAAIGMSDNGYGFSEFFLTRPESQLKQGSSWADSVVTETVRFVNQYVVTSVTDQQVEIRITTDMKMNALMKQAGMEVKSNMKGFSTATRIYDRKTGLMIIEKRATEMTGMADAMGVNAPMTIKSTTQINIK